MVVTTVEDTCPSCDENHLGTSILPTRTRIPLTFLLLDLSEGAFEALTGGSLDPPGEFNIAW